MLERRGLDRSGLLTWEVWLSVSGIGSFHNRTLSFRNVVQLHAGAASLAHLNSREPRRPDAPLRSRVSDSVSWPFPLLLKDKHEIGKEQQ